MCIVRKRFDFNVASATATVNEKFTLDKTAKKLKGLFLTSDREDLLFYRGVQKIEINGIEVFPENYESKLLMVSLNIAPDERVKSLNGMETGNGEIKISFTDNFSSVAAFAAYRVSLYVEYETE